MRDAQRINAFFRAGVVAAIGYMIVILMFRITQELAFLIWRSCCCLA
ncbi:MAG: hypothetical protein M5U34_03930 [Chloroflexi bacterium]|nr:hypothetical protein [Chloroflexota bacterium]